MCKHKKFVRVIYLLIVSLLCISLLVGCSSSHNYKNAIFELVEKQKDMFIADITENDFSTSLSFDRIECVDVLGQCVNFYCGGYGISTSSHEFGFYYSFDDQPLGVWDNAVFASSDELTGDGNGFSGGFQHNSYYTEKICDNFWYYELIF